MSHLCSAVVLVVSRSFLDSVWPQIKFVLPSRPTPGKAIVVLLEELSALDLAGAPDFNVFLKNSHVLHWNETGFWNKLRFYLPEARPQHLLASKTGQSRFGQQQTTALTFPGSPKSATAESKYASSGWHYDGLVGSGSTNLPNSNNSSSTSTRSTTLQQPRQQQSSSNCSDNNTTSSSGSASKTLGGNVRLTSNPLNPESPGPRTPWDAASAAVADQHTYQTIGDVVGPTPPPQEPIYHTLEPSTELVTAGGQQFDTLGKLEVMLPNGQMVPATLVRQKNGGGVVPLVEIGGGGRDGPGAFSSPSPQLRHNRMMMAAKEKRRFV